MPVMTESNTAAIALEKANTSGKDQVLLATPAEKQNQPKQPKTLAFWLIFTALGAATFLSALDLTAVTTALPVIAHDLNSHNFSWVGSSYALSSTVFIPVFGGLAQTFGRKGPLLSCILIFGIGSAVSGSAKDIGALLVGRTVQGIGVGFFFFSMSILSARLKFILFLFGY